MSFNDNKHNNLQRYADNQHTENNYSVVSQKLLALVLICLVSCKSVTACKKALGDQLVGRKITKKLLNNQRKCLLSKITLCMGSAAQY